MNFQLNAYLVVSFVHGNHLMPKFSHKKLFTHFNATYYHTELQKFS